MEVDLDTVQDDMDSPKEAHSDGKAESIISDYNRSRDKNFNDNFRADP